MDDDLLNKIERQYGEFGLGVFLACVILSVSFLFVLWIWAVINYFWPILLPSIIAGYMLYKVNQGEPK